MLVRRLRALHVLLHARRVVDPELLGEELHRPPWHVQRILKEAAHRADRAQLYRETEPMMIRSAPRDQVSIRVIEVVEEALNRGRRSLTGEAAVRGNLYLYRRTGRQRRQPSSL